jgi:hypothetical protein
MLLAQFPNTTFPLGGWFLLLGISLKRFHQPVPIYQLFLEFGPFSFSFSECRTNKGF